MNANDTKKFTRYLEANRHVLLGNMKVGPGRSIEMQESNYDDLVYYLAQSGLRGAIEADVKEAAALFTKLTNRPLDVSKPAGDNGAAQKLVALKRDSSDCQAVISGVDCRLDIDQLKHQNLKSPIGSRQKGGGNRFIESCNAAWHIASTLPFMAAWANGLGVMQNGQQEVQKQSLPQHSQFFQGAIHFEGSCLMAGGTKYTLFHCYPANGSPLLGAKA